MNNYMAMARIYACGKKKNKPVVVACMCACANEQLYGYGSHLCLWQKIKIKNKLFAFKRFNSTIILETFATNSLNASQTIKQLCQLVLNLLLRQDPRTNCTTNLLSKPYQ